MTALVRFATANDAEALALLRWLSRSESECARQTYEAFARDFVNWFQEALASGRWQVAVALSEQGGLDGCMYLQVVDKVPVPGEARRAWGYVTNAFVREGRRNRGAGAAMLGALIESARKLSLELLMVWPSSEAVPFYERAGFLAPEAQRTELPADEPSFILHLATV